jgi:deoxyhypusine synthase
MNRVTDTCIPEMEAMRRIETAVLEEWVAADQAGERYFPHEFMYKCCAAAARGELPDRSEELLAAGRREKNLPIFVPGWEDCHPGQHVRRPL